MVTTDYARTIFFDKNFILTNVLYMPQFSFNLIFVPKLTHCLDCQLIFNNDTCLRQNSYSKKIIDATDLKGELYILNHPQVAISNTLSCISESSIKTLSLKHTTYVNYLNHNHCNILQLFL